MRDRELAEVLVEISKQLRWRGPTNRKIGHVVITRRQAEILLEQTRGLLKDIVDLEQPS